MPNVGSLDALIHVPATTICGTDGHILECKYPARPYRRARASRNHREVRVRRHGISGRPTSYCSCDDRVGSLERFVLVESIHSAAPEPPIVGNCSAGSVSARVRIGSAVAVFAQGSIGICGAAGAKLMGVTTIIGIETASERIATVKSMGADHLMEFRNADPVSEIMTITDGRDTDVAIETLGMPESVEAALRGSRRVGRLSSLGVCSSGLPIPLAAFTAGRGNHKIITTLCPGGKEHIRRVMEAVD